MPAGISTSDFWYILPEIVLTGGALLVLIADVALPKENRAALGWVTLLVIGATLASLAPFTSAHVEVAHGLLAVDRFALFFKIVFLVAAAITVLISMRYLEVEGAAPGEYYFLILCATLGMMIMAGGIDLITIFIGLETMAVSFYILAGFIKPNQRSNEAAVKYFLLGAFSLGVLLYGMSLMYGLSGTTNLRVMAPLFAGQERDPRLVLAVILVVAGVGFKIAAVPFHMWAPDVYEGAPTPVTAFLSVGSKAASFAMLLRIFLEGLPVMSADWRLLFEVLAIVTMTVGNVAAVTQTNLKRMLAYSSVAHAGYVLIGVVAAASTIPAVRMRGITATLIYLLIYSFMQLGAFAVIVLLRRQDVVGDELKDFSGLHFRQPFAAFAMLLFMLSLGGIPPTAGFMGKFWLFGAAIEAGYVWLAVIGVLNSAISLYYYIRVVVFMYLKKETIGSEPQVSGPLAVALGVAVVATLALGVYPRQLFEVAEASARTLGAAVLTAASR
ncbi:MAG TPA: NADH-quinone oxidoreductase subunit N [Vicinamibacterales bacterium]|jgi:NADH-quinone oxidoreductase subunit N|nr:NADH-quinone oxidoreductase subunit N [Vicinamibacterales bacterium]